MSDRSDDPYSPVNITRGCTPNGNVNDQDGGDYVEEQPKKASSLKLLDNIQNDNIEAGNKDGSMQAREVELNRGNQKLRFL